VRSSEANMHKFQADRDAAQRVVQFMPELPHWRPRHVDENRPSDR
jgi:hypothetical protein